MAEDLRNKLTKLIKDLQADGKVGDDEAFDVAANALNDEPELVVFMEFEMGIGDPVGYLATRI